MERGVGRARHRAAQSRSFTPVGSSRPAGPSHLWESRSFAPAALSTVAPSHLGESRSFAPAVLRMTGSLASLGREGNHPPFLFPFPKRRGVVILRERAERARAKDLLSRRGPAKVCERRTCCHAECERGICSVEAREIDLVQLTQVGSISSVHGEDGGGLCHFRRNSPPSATPVVAQNRNIHLSNSHFSSASFTSSWCQRPSHFASDSARRCSSLASNRAKLRSFRSRRSARYVASTALNQFTSSFVMSSPNFS